MPSQLHQSPTRSTLDTAEYTGQITGFSGAQGTIGNAAVASSLPDMAASWFGGGILPLMSGTPYGQESEERMKAREELSAKLQVGEGEGLVDGKAMVSQEQFDKMLDTYESIKNGTSNIQISGVGMSDEDAEKFKAKVLDNMTTMMQTDAGRELLDELANQEHLKPEDREDIVISDGTKSYFDHGIDGNQLAGNRCVARNEHDGEDGTGTGSAVFFTGNDRVLKNPDGTDMHMPSDAVLFHELVHARHNLNGTMDHSKVDPADGNTQWKCTDLIDGHRGVDRDEHQAAGLGYYADDYLTENTYRSQQRDLAYSLPPGAERDAMLQRYMRREQYYLEGGARPPVSDTTGMTEYDEMGWPTK